jgi:hypothetical protein
MMTKADQVARGKLIDYAKKFLRVQSRPNEAIAVSAEQVAAFAAQVREGCRQDLIHLIVQLASDDPEPMAKAALLALAGTVDEGESIELWGLPDCACGKTECVYCGRGFNIDSRTVESGGTPEERER